MGEVKLSNLNEAQAHKTAQEIVRLEAVVSKMKADLKAYVEQEGGLFVSAGKIWSMNESMTVKFTAAQKTDVVKLLAMKGINFLDVAKISYADLIKVGLTHDEAIRFGAVSTSTKFSSKNEK